MKALHELKRHLTPQVLMLIGLALILGYAAGYYFGYDTGYEKAASAFTQLGSIPSFISKH